MNRKLTLLLALVSMLLVAILSGVKFVDVANANPYMHVDVYLGESSPPVGTKPPAISIASPTNNAVYSSSNASLTFNVSLPSSGDGLSIKEIYYEANWLYYSIIPVGLDGLYVSTSHNNPSTFSINLTGLCEGVSSLRIYAVGEGFHDIRNVINQGIIYTRYYYSFKITGSSTVNFTIDTTPPNITNLSVENKTYNSTTIPLSFNVNEETPQLRYKLDSQANTTITGNTTLAGISEGTHSIVVYANDTAGNIGKSDTVFFTINTQPSPSPSPTPTPLSSPTQQPTSEPTQSAKPTIGPAVHPGQTFPPIPPIIMVVVAIAISIGVGLAVYFTRFRKKKTTVLKADV